jgi:hypothetical protein
MRVTAWFTSRLWPTFSATPHSVTGDIYGHSGDDTAGGGHLRHALELSVYTTWHNGGPSAMLNLGALWGDLHKH